MLSCAVVMVGAGLSLGGGNAFGYAGEQGTVGANVTPATVSTHHLHLTRALAYCAGFDAATTIRNPVDPVISHTDAKEAEIIAIYDELTDQGTIRNDPETPETKWTNITPTGQWTYQDKTAENLGCTKVPKMVFPVTAKTAPSKLPDESFWDPKVGWFTNRFGPWAAEFHFPTDEDLSKLKNFAMNGGVTLDARTVYAFGTESQNMWTADCYPKPFSTLMTSGINGSLTSGSLEALGTYLHSLGDSYSHGVCRNNYWSANPNPKPPWYYHTLASAPPACVFNSHSLEFGCPATSEQVAFENNVVNGGIDIFNNLYEYATKHGKTPRLKSAGAHQDWLRRQLERYTTLFKTNTFPAAGACRVEFAYRLMQACTTAAQTDINACLADVEVVNCAQGGKVGADCVPHSSFPITPRCSDTAPKTTTATR